MALRRTSLAGSAAAPRPADRSPCARLHSHRGANVIWKKARRKEIPSAQPYIEELANIPDAVVLQPSTELVMKAAALAVQIDHPVYDCVYLACTEAEAAPLVTADARLAERAREAYPTVEVWNIVTPRSPNGLPQPLPRSSSKTTRFSGPSPRTTPSERPPIPSSKPCNEGPAAYGYSHRKTRTPISTLQRTSGWSSSLPTSLSTNESTSKRSPGTVAKSRRGPIGLLLESCLPDGCRRPRLRGVIGSPLAGRLGAAPPRRSKAQLTGAMCLRVFPLASVKSTTARRSMSIE